MIFEFFFMFLVMLFVLLYPSSWFLCSACLVFFLIYFLFIYLFVVSILGVRQWFASFASLRIVNKVVLYSVKKFPVSTRCFCSSLFTYSSKVQSLSSQFSCFGEKLTTSMRPDDEIGSQIGRVTSRRGREMYTDK